VAGSIERFLLTAISREIALDRYLSRDNYRDMSLDDSGQGSPEPGARRPELPELRRITDAQTMRALAHPVRVAIFEVLGLEGPMTATEVGERIGDSPTTCSFHLRQLAKYGFVEEAGGGKGRARPWRMTSLGISFGSTHDDPETQVAASALSRMLRERQLDRYRTWLETRATYPREWQNAAEDSEYVLYVTVKELEQLTNDLQALLRPRFLERLTDPSKRPPDAVPVEMLLFSYPLSLPAPGQEEPAGQGEPAAEGAEAPEGEGQ
jgi:DNA-binding transcriptional ArsR family regulator